MPAQAAGSFRLTLWAKLVTFTTLIVVGTCSALGWFFLQQQAASVTEGLIESGTLLAKHLAVSCRYSVIVNDHVQIREQIAGLLAMDEVAYALVRTTDGRILGAAGNGDWRPLLANQHVTDLIRLPQDPQTASVVSDVATIRSLQIQDGAPRMIERPSLGLAELRELIRQGPSSPTSYFDIAVPVIGSSASFDNDPALNLTFHETRDPAGAGTPKPSSSYGMVHVGLSDTHQRTLLHDLFQKVLLLTILIIAIGVVGILFLARRITSPVKSLTVTAARLAEGDFSVRATSRSTDEIGDLTRMFNNMVSSLQDHENKLQDLTHTLELRVQVRTEELQQANRRLQELDRLKTQLVASASHELRTPLTSMKVYLSNLRDGIGGPVTPVQAETLRSLGDNTDRLRRLIDDLLDLSRFQGTQTVLQREPVHLGELMQELITTFRPLSSQKGLSIRLDFSPSLAPVWGDKDKLRRVFSNLLDNALKFSPPGSEIRLSAEPAGGKTVSVCVADPGCGIARDEIEKIFLPFYRSANGVKTRGSGLGLAIVKELVELHGGSVRVESTIGQGSRFFIDLPLITHS